MCLTKADLSLTWDKNEEAFVGIGYKSIDKIVLKKKYPLNKWVECNVDWNNNLIEKSYETDVYRNKYHPAFHIFLKLESAKRYGNHSSFRKTCKVMFSEVLSFGTNSDGSSVNVPCVVARWMKIVKVY